ncbi:GntP family permease [Raineyella fluvialis]|uniref:GntP family permease n=1 Tax=Raineyella fluvialis TaxID=2662261 RepID=UPI001E473748|nr:GntP family permease [Raineyella fluvialis]
MSLVIVIAALAFLMWMAYKGHSVILFAPIAALAAVLLTHPGLVAPVYSGLFMDKMVGFIKSYFPVFLLGAIFGKLMEMSGYARSIVSAVIKVVGARSAMLTIVLVGALLTYGGVSLFVVVFAVYPFAAEMFRQGDIPKRLIPGTIALGAFTFTMDALPGTPQIQNIIPTTFFRTTGYAAPILGTVGGLFVFGLGMLYLERQRRKAVATGEGYGEGHLNEPHVFIDEGRSPHPLLSLAPLVIVGVANLVLTTLIPRFYGTDTAFQSTVVGKPAPVTVPTAANVAIWAVEGALALAILFIVATAFRTIREHFTEGVKPAIAGSLLATMNTASEYGFGAVIASLAGFGVAARGLTAIPDPWSGKPSVSMSWPASPARPPAV